MTIEYLESQVLTASPYRLHLMVVDGAVKFARRARLALEENDISAMHVALDRSRACVAELISGLRDAGDRDLIDSLKALFAFVYRSLALADPQRNVRLIDDAIRVLEIHRETWIELGERLPKDTESAAPAPHVLSWTM